MMSPALAQRPAGIVFSKPRTDIVTTSQLQMRQPRPAPPITHNNFPENRLQLDRHYLQVRQARPDPANAFR